MSKDFVYLFKQTKLKTRPQPKYLSHSVLRGIVKKSKNMSELRQAIVDFEDNFSQDSESEEEFLEVGLDKSGLKQLGRCLPNSLAKELQDFSMTLSVL